MHVRPSILRLAKQFTAPFLTCLCLCLPAAGQQAPTTTTNLLPERPLPDSPQPDDQLTLGERFHLEVHTTVGPRAFILPAFESGITMAHPPDNYPHDWSDGPGAFGRIYGAELARHITGGMTHFAVAAIDREDPRYYPCLSTRFVPRVIHALTFTLVDRADSGHRTIAVSNLAGSAAAGFVGMAFLPPGFNDTTHAYQRAAVEMSTFAAHNLVAEFSPGIVRVLHKLHVSDRIADSFLPPDSPALHPRP